MHSHAVTAVAPGALVVADCVQGVHAVLPASALYVPLSHGAQVSVGECSVLPSHVNSVVAGAAGGPGGAGDGDGPPPGCTSPKPATQATAQAAGLEVLVPAIVAPAEQPGVEA